MIDNIFLTISILDNEGQIPIGISSAAGNKNQKRIKE
jgi:hypothetical protein